MFSHLASVGRYNTAPGFLLHENTTSAGLSGLEESKCHSLPSLESKFELPHGQFLRHRLRGDSVRTQIVGTKCTADDMIFDPKREFLMVLRDTIIFM